MNTGVQRSGATPPAARTATTKPVGAEPGNVFGQGKNAPLIAMAHEIPYVATATVADLRDLEAKVERAMELRGARYLHVLVPCPLGWGSASRDTIRIARLATETGLFPVFEAERGEVTGVSKIRRPRPGRGVPARPQRSRLRAPVRRRASARDRRASPRAARRPAPTATSRRVRTLAARRPDGQALRDHARRRLEPRQQDRLLAHRARRATSTGCRRATTPARPARTSRRGSTTPRRATTSAAGAQIMEDNPLPGDHGPGLLPPVRDRLQPRPARRGGRHQLGRALPRRRGDRAGLDASTVDRAAVRQARARRRRRARPGCRPPTTCARLGHEVDDPRGRAAAPAA